MISKLPKTSVKIARHTLQQASVPIRQRQSTSSVTKNDVRRLVTKSTVETIEITQPDDWHLHVRDGEAMKSVVQHSAAVFKRAVIMPNLTPPVTTVDMAQAYRQRIMDALPSSTTFNPLMTLYFTDSTSPDDVHAAQQSGIIGIKLYPKGATTNSNSGVTDVTKIYPTLQAMEQMKLPLLVHGEVTDPSVDVFDRERVFIETILSKVLDKFPNLKVVLEHITTKQAVDFVKSAPDNVGATITPQHIMYNRNEIFKGGIRPHYFCLPILKRETHREAVCEAAVSGNHKFFLGTDSAPHATKAKIAPCGCAGIYSAPVAMPLYAQVFEQEGKLKNLEAFSSLNGPLFYGLPSNDKNIVLKKQNVKVNESFQFGPDKVVPIKAGETLDWDFVGFK